MYFKWFDWYVVICPTDVNLSTGIIGLQNRLLHIKPFINDSATNFPFLTISATNRPTFNTSVLIISAVLRAVCHVIVIRQIVFGRFITGSDGLGWSSVYT